LVLFFGVLAISSVPPRASCSGNQLASRLLRNKCKFLEHQTLRRGNQNVAILTILSSAPGTFYLIQSQQPHKISRAQNRIINSKCALVPAKLHTNLRMKRDGGAQQIST
jgi:hypothetical protein